MLMHLKAPTKCCASPTLLWVRGQQFFVCPCGKTKVDDRGIPEGTNKFNPFRKKGGRPKKDAERPVSDEDLRVLEDRTYEDI